MHIGAARRRIAELLVDVWLRAGSLDNIDPYTYGYIEALNTVLKEIGGTLPKIKECEDLVCKVIIGQTGPGRTRKYCSDVCRARAYRTRKKETP